MKIVNASHQILNKYDWKTPYEFIELIGRKCYKSEDKITEDSAVKFVQGLVKRQHFAMLEHWWVHLIYIGSSSDFDRAFSQLATTDLKYIYNPLDYMEVSYGRSVYISAPLRVFFELLAVSNDGLKLPLLLDEMCSCVANDYPEIFGGNNLSFKRTANFNSCGESFLVSELRRDFGNYMGNDFCNKEIMKHITHTILFICDRGVSHELVRHRPCSFAQESTRYCNYCKGQFGNEITVIEPLFFNKYDRPEEYLAWLNLCEYSEKIYNDLISMGASPQEARSVLPNSLKTEVIVTANEVEWQHIVDLRAKGTTGKPHPQMVEVMTPVYEELRLKTGIAGGRIK